MTAALWMPFMLGRTVVPTVLVWKETLAASGAWAAAAPHVERLLAAVGQPGGLQSLAASVAKAGPEAEAWEGVSSRISIFPLLRRLAEDFEAHLSGPGLSDWVCLAVGYCEPFSPPLTSRKPVAFSLVFRASDCSSCDVEHSQVLRSVSSEQGINLSCGER